MSETDVVKSFGHRKWGGNTQDINVSLSIDMKAIVDVAPALSADSGIYPSRPLSLIALGGDVLEKLPVSAGKAVLCKAVNKPEANEA
jgi:hypothetical protein